jgi:hypothetical protein
MLHGGGGGPPLSLLSLLSLSLPDSSLPLTHARRSKGDQQGADLERVEMARKRYEEVTVDLAPGDAVFFSCLTLHASPGNFSERRRLAFASCFTAATNVQYRDAYIPCVECTVMPDAALMQTMGADGTPTLTDAEDKIMLAPDEGVERARKDSQN